MPATSLSDERRTNLWDRIGMSLSGICLVHCLVFPIALALLPLWPVFDDVHAWLHPVFAVLILPTTLFAMARGRKMHGRRDVQWLLGVGVAIIVVSGFLGHEMPGALSETAVTVSGSLLLIAGHWRNWRAGHACHTPVHA